jgi:TolB protein
MLMMRTGWHILWLAGVLLWGSRLDSEPLQQPPDLRQEIGKIIVRPGSGPSLAVADFVPRNEPAAPAAALISDVLARDLDFAGVINLVGRSLHPQNRPARPEEVDFASWGGDPARADYLVFGNVSVIGPDLIVETYVYDVQARNRLYSRQHRFSTAEARHAAHRIADDIVKTLTGIDGIATSRIAFVSGEGRRSEIYVMDYDGANVRPFTREGSTALFPAWSPDGRKIAYVSFLTGVPNIHIRSYPEGAPLPFPRFPQGTTISPAFSPDGRWLAFCSSKDSNSTQLYVASSDGSIIRQLTNERGIIHSSPRWNPRTGREIAFISNRSGTPQIYIIDADGANLRRVLDHGGFADSPAWSPDGRFLAFAWRPPGATRFDIFLMDIATRQIVQLTDGPGDNESPAWAPNGRHLAFQSNRTGRFEIYLMHIDGTGVRQITHIGGRSPAWVR